MPNIADTIRQRHAAMTGGVGAAGSGRLRRVEAFGSNPGALAGWWYAPEGGTDMPLVVVLHGCTQTAADYDRGSGWSALGERHGFAVLFPEQQRANNPNLCFNWFLDEDTRRGGGEVLSIRQMIADVCDRLPIDPRRVFVTGLSAGGAMAGAMLAAYPELFAGGAIVAGLPYGAASSVSQAMERMRGVGLLDEAAGADAIRRASPHRGPWPPVSIWHGDADRTVNVANAEAIVGQWRRVHGVGASPDRVGVVDGQRHRVWLGPDGTAAVEEYRVAGLGHGAPQKTGGADGCGTPGPYMIEAGISSTRRQAERWGLVREVAGAAVVPREPASAQTVSPTPDAGLSSMVNDTIERALRSAGLMR